MFLITDLTATPPRTIKSNDTKDVRDMILGITDAEDICDSAEVIMSHMNIGCSYTFSPYFTIRCVNDSDEIGTICASGERPSILRVETPLGAIIVRATHDSDYPGVYVDLRRTDADQDLLLALVEFTETEGDLPKAGHVITRVYGDAMADEYTDRIVHHGIEDYFRIEEAEGNE